MTRPPLGLFLNKKRRRRQANAAYAAEVLATYAPGDQVLVHDYHLMLVPGLLRAAEPSMRIGWFGHVPWPHELLWRRLPARKQLLESLLCADLLGFQVMFWTNAPFQKNVLKVKV